MGYDRDKAMADLDDMGEIDPDEVYDYGTDEGFREFVSGQGLDPDKYLDRDDNGGSNIDEGCFLTTACTYSMGLPDNCIELETLRRFRDTYLKSTEDGKSEIKEYYIVAPKIVSMINLESDSKRIWKSIYDSLVKPAVSLIEENKLSEAHRLYKEKYLELKNKYLDK